jgi:hypothetical protein
MKATPFSFISLLAALLMLAATGRAVEPKCVSKSSYRTKLKDLGLVEVDQDVFHIIAGHHGGADHPDNYDFVRGRKWNQAISSNYDYINCYLAGETKCEKAVAISKQLGNFCDSKRSKNHKYYTGSSAAELHKLGEDALRDFRALERAKKRGDAFLSLTQGEARSEL